MKLYHIHILYFVLIIFLPAKMIAQEIKLSDTAEVSILTMGPGDVLNDSFGHSAFRVKDTKQNIDVVYNYGVYDFNTPYIPWTEITLVPFIIIMQSKTDGLKNKCLT
jgi:hypothetical protein